MFCVFLSAAYTGTLEKAVEESVTSVLRADSRAFEIAALFTITQ
jgi:hypothetical protein